MDWIYYALRWYAMLLVVGALFVGITSSLLSPFFDRGYAFAKTVGILVISYLVFVVATLHIAPFHLYTLISIALLGGGVGIYLQRSNKHSLPWKVIIAEELFFFVAFLFWTYVRGQEPSLHGLEKFMDFGFIQSILRTTYFPALDMWYAKLPINYYYFGHLTGAVQIKLAGVPADVGYNLILATIFAQATVSAFSLIANIVYAYHKRLKYAVFFGLIGTWILNFGGNLHTIYLFTTGYPVDKPIPFWEILSGYNPAKYWYPNATRFIPFTIHEFPSYSYVVADLHGHVFDILFVLLTFAFLFIFYTKRTTNGNTERRSAFPTAILLGFMTAIHYMTNAFDGPIYILLIVLLFFLMFRWSRTFFIHCALLCATFLLFSLPFSYHFKPFASEIGMNCAPSFLTDIGKIGPFIFEKGNCQPDPLWMLFVLWGFFFISFLLFIWAKSAEHFTEHPIDDFIFILFAFSFFLILIPEFFYAKDIYPLHFRANTMFKLGYQAFMMLSVASAYTLFVIVRHASSTKRIRIILWFIPFMFVAVYLFYATPSYYGDLSKTPQLTGMNWLKANNQDSLEIIQYINSHITGQPVILEAQGDSYTDFNHISAYTGLPTVAGWWVHEWLWRGSSDVVGKRIPDIVAIYESKDIPLVKRLLKKYDVSYVIVSTLERQKYKELQDAKFAKIGKKIFTSSDGFGALYQIK